MFYYVLTNRHVGPHIEREWREEGKKIWRLLYWFSVKHGDAEVHEWLKNKSLISINFKPSNFTIVKSTTCSR